jgi:endonuclease YncB( thermonuclease family)
MPKKATKQVQTPQPDWLWRYRVTILRVLDGDTVEILFDQGLGNWSIETCRLYGINAAEIRKDGGLVAKQNLESEIAVAGGETGWGGKPVIWVRTIKNRSESKDVQEKYGRYLVELYRTSEDMDKGFAASINQGMIDNGFAKPYFGVGAAK